MGDREANACAKTLQQLLKILPKFITIPFYLLVLFYIDYKLTLILTFLSVFALFPLYFVNIKIAHLGIAAKSHRKQSARERMEVKQNFKSSINPVKKEDVNGELNFLKYTDLHDLNNFLASISNEITLNIFTAFSFATVIIYEGEKLLLGEFPWEQMIIFLTALRLLLTASKSCVLSLSKISTHYIRLKFYHSFIEETRGFDRHEKKAWNLSSLQPSVCVSGLEKINVNDFYKQTVALLLPNVLDKRFLFTFSEAFIYRLESDPIRILHPGSIDIWISFKGKVDLVNLRDLLNIPDEIEQDFFKKTVEDIYAKVQAENGLSPEKVSLVDLNSTLSFSTFLQLPATTQNILFLAASTFSDRKLVILPYAEGLEVLLGRFKDLYKSEKTYFLLYENYQDIKEKSCFLLNNFDDIKVLKVEDLKREPDKFLVTEGEGNRFDAILETSEE